MAFPDASLQAPPAPQGSKSLGTLMQASGSTCFHRVPGACLETGAWTSADVLKPELNMQVEELRLTQAQNAAAETPLIASDKKKGKAKKGAAAALPTQNGQGDSLSINSSILQVKSSTLCFINICAVLLLQSMSLKLAWHGDHGMPNLIVI